MVRAAMERSNTNTCVIKSTHRLHPIVELTLTGNVSFAIPQRAEHLLDVTQDAIGIVEAIVAMRIAEPRVVEIATGSDADAAERIKELLDRTAALRTADKRRTEAAANDMELGIAVHCTGSGTLSGDAEPLDDLLVVRATVLDTRAITLASYYDVWLPHTLDGDTQSEAAAAARRQLQELIRFLQDHYGARYEIEPEWENRFVTYDKQTCMPMNESLDGVPFDIYSVYEGTMLRKTPL